MEESYRSVLRDGFAEYTEKKSRFLSFARPVSTEADALAFLSSIRSRYPDARHAVYAYKIRENQTMRYSDDKEPQGTAGLPTLDAIRKQDLTDCAVVTVRYFGGVLLGTGGLVHAYSTSAVDALKNAEIIVYDRYTIRRWTVSYSDYQKITPLFASSGVSADQTDFAGEVTILTSALPAADEACVAICMEATCGRLRTEWIEERHMYKFLEQK